MSAPPAQFEHGARVYHRARRQFGGVVAHEKLDASPSSTFVQFDGSTDILECSTVLLDAVEEE